MLDYTKNICRGWLVSPSEINDLEWDDPQIAIKGPWLEGPSLIAFTDNITKKKCLLIRNQYLVWCGYVGVHPDHPFFCINIDDERLHLLESIFDRRIDFTGEREYDASLWWIGFDCQHYPEYSPYLHLLASTQFFKDKKFIYRTASYVINKTRALAEALKKIES